MNLVKLYDTTLRDGTQSEDISFLLEDKIRIAHHLDESGIHYIEGGWPGTTPRMSPFSRRSRRKNCSMRKSPL
jgi:2-isopropylmalate synthase